MVLPWPFILQQMLFSKALFKISPQKFSLIMLPHEFSLKLFWLKCPVITENEMRDFYNYVIKLLYGVIYLNPT